MNNESNKNAKAGKESAYLGPSHPAIRWYCIIVWIEILMTAGIAVVALMAPDLLIMFLGAQRYVVAVPFLDTTFLVHQVGYFSILLALLYLPAALSPRRYPAYAALVAVARLVSTLFRFFVISAISSSDISIVIVFFDALLSGILFFLLWKGVPEDFEHLCNDLKKWLYPAWYFQNLKRGFRRAFANRRFAMTFSAVAVLFVVGTGVLWDNLARKVPPEHFSSEAEHFKYGSVAAMNGFPLYLWEVIPEVFANQFPKPGGWEAFGFVTEPGHAVPVGWAQRTVGYPGIAPNCALCHTATYRTAPESQRVLVPGGASSRIDFDGFLNFLFRIADDSRFTADTLMPVIEKNHRLSTSERLLYRYLLIPGFQEFIHGARRDFAWIKLRPEWGPGRMDAFNIIKFNLFRLTDDGTIGNADIKVIWQQQNTDGHWQQWNGSGTNTHDANLFAAALLVLGIPAALDQPSFERMNDFLYKLPPPVFPFPIDSTRSQAGRKIYDEHCARCHAVGAEMTGQIASLDEIGTDPHFHAMWTERLVERILKVDDPPFKYSAVQVSDGYVNLPLDGIWLRSPYLHNGSVPTLWDLLQKPEDRPKVFYRGIDVIDAEKVGFISEEPIAGKDGWRFDTHRLGNSNKGHRYGTELPEQSKRDLIDYMKSL